MYSTCTRVYIIQVDLHSFTLSEIFLANVWLTPCGDWELLRRHLGRRVSFVVLPPRIRPGPVLRPARCASAFSQRKTLSTRSSNVKWCLPYASSVVTHVPRCTRPSLRFRYLGSKVMRNSMHVESGGRAWERGYAYQQVANNVIITSLSSTRQWSVTFWTIYMYMYIQQPK